MRPGLHRRAPHGPLTRGPPTSGDATRSKSVGRVAKSRSRRDAALSPPRATPPARTQFFAGPLRTRQNPPPPPRDAAYGFAPDEYSSGNFAHPSGTANLSAVTCAEFPSMRAITIR